MHEELDNLYVGWSEQRRTRWAGM